MHVQNRSCSDVRKMAHVHSAPELLHVQEWLVKKNVKRTIGTSAFTVLPPFATITSRRIQWAHHNRESL